MEKKVSILIPVYNGEAHIAETIESCLRQTYQCLEIIIVDDGSSDGTEDIIRTYCRRYANVRLLRQPHLGAQCARNYALDHASGDYIQYLDADDVLAFNKLGAQVKRLEEHDDDCIASCRFMRFTDDVRNAYYRPNHIDRDFEIASNWLKTSWLNDDMTTPHCWLISRKLAEKAGPWDQRLIKNQDGEYFCRAILAARSIRFCGETEVYYRLTGKSSVSRQFDYKSAKSTLKSCDLYHQHILGAGLDGFDRAIASCYYAFWLFYFPHFPDLLKMAEERIHALNYALIDFVREGKIRWVAKMIGVKSAVRLQMQVHKITELGGELGRACIL